MSYVSNSADERRKMLEALGVSDFSELIQEIPESLRLKTPLNLPLGTAEFEVIQILKGISAKTWACSNMICFMGGGAYDHYVPAAVDAIISRSEFLTAYTPYQAEVSQGTLQSIYEFQSLVCRLTGMDLANASMYDGASASAEAVLMSLANTKNKTVLLAPGIHPTYKQVIGTYTSGIDINIAELPEKNGLLDLDGLSEYDLNDVACVMVQSPNFFGLIENIRKVGDMLSDKKAMFVVVANPLSLALLTSPGEVGADLAVGEMQVFGNGLNFGGPYLGYFAANKKYTRKIPGRLVARTKDVDGNDGYVLTLQTREQHIRRDKATSNICTNQALCALAATVHLSLMGENGIRNAATMSVRKAHYLAQKLSDLSGFKLIYSGNFFNEFVIHQPLNAVEFAAALEKEHIMAGVPLSRFYPGRENEILVAVTEKRTREELDYYVETAARITQGKGLEVG